MSLLEMRGESNAMPSTRRSSSCRITRTSRRGSRWPVLSRVRYRKEPLSSSMPSTVSAKNGLCRSERRTPIVCVRPRTRPRASSLGRYPSSAAARSTAARRFSLTLGASRITSETRDLETFARSATSSIVTRAGLLRAPSLIPTSSRDGPVLGSTRHATRDASLAPRLLLTQPLSVFLEVTLGVLRGDQRYPGVDRLRYRLVFRRVHRLFYTDQTHLVRVLCHRGIYSFVLDDRHRGFLGSVVAHQQDISGLPARLEDLQRPEGHLVVGREDGIHVRVPLKNVFHRRYALGAVEVRGHLLDDFDVGALYGIPHPGDPILTRCRSRNAVHERQRPPTFHLVDDVLPGDLATLDVIRSDVGYLPFPAGDVRVDDDNGHLFARALEDGLQLVGRCRRDGQRVDLLGQHVFDHGYLLVYGELRGRSE